MILNFDTEFFVSHEPIKATKCKTCDFKQKKIDEMYAKLDKLNKERGAWISDRIKNQSAELNRLQNAYKTKKDELSDLKEKFNKLEQFAEDFLSESCKLALENRKLNKQLKHESERADRYKRLYEFHAENSVMLVRSLDALRKKYEKILYALKGYYWCQLCIHEDKDSHHEPCSSCSTCDCNMMSYEFNEKRFIGA